MGSNSAGEFELEDVLREVRARVEERRRAAANRPFLEGPTVGDLARLEAAGDPFRAEFRSDRWLVGRSLSALKRAFRLWLTPVFAQQAAYNGINAAVVRSCVQGIERLASDILAVRNDLLECRTELTHLTSHTGEELARRGELLETLRKRLDSLEEAHTFKAGDVGSLRDGTAAGLASLGEELRALRERLATLERRVRRGTGVPPVVPETLALPEPEDDSLEAARFEERFRGSEVQIKQRQRVYLPYVTGKGRVLDLGCGRGEFVELLREAGIPARGIDTNADMVLLCRDKGLEVERAAAVPFLESLPAGSLGAVVGLQVVEHFDPRELPALARAAHRALMPGGIVILETINPACLLTFAESFYIDFSHRRPIHPEALRYLLDIAGFARVEILWLSPVDESMRIPELHLSSARAEELHAFNRAVGRLNALLYGHLEYSALGHR